MTPQEALAKIKLLFTEKEPQQEPQDFKEAKLADGITIVSWSGELLGAELMLITEEGKIPAPDGEHTLESGEVVSVSEGKVTNVTEKKEEVEMKEKKKEYDMEAFETTLKECMAKIEALEKKMSEASIESTVDEAMKAINTQKEAFLQLVEIVDKIAKSPSEDPADKGDLFSSMKVSKEDTENRINEFAEALKSLKTK